MTKSVYVTYGLLKFHPFGLPDVIINKLHHVQNKCGKLILRKGKYDSPTQCMMELQGLPFRSRLSFKILILIR